MTIDSNYIDMLAYKIFSKKVNPYTHKAFEVEDIQKQEYRIPVIEKIKELEEAALKEANKGDKSNI